ncbi:MAG TPA: hypothetical protein PLL69_10670 [Gemmatimonadales bacterium]|nr:hypothetical protein [Gemmatimonadales bacterium]
MIAVRQTQDQAAGNRPTVGDTLTVVQRVPLEAGALVQPRSPVDSTIATLVAPAMVSREGDSVRIAYQIAIWAPGQHRLVIPGAVTVSGTGVVDTLPDAVVALDVASVLPQGAVADTLSVRGVQPWVERSDPSGWPFLVLLPPLLLAIAIAAWRWRRRGRSVAAVPVPGQRVAPRQRLRNWADAGELDLALDHLTAILPSGDETDHWRARVDEVRFDPGARQRRAELLDQGLDLLERLGAAQ